MSDNDDFAPTVMLGMQPQAQQPPPSEARKEPPRSTPPSPPGPPPSPFASGAEPVSEPQRMQFTGTGGEYFRIWIVNLILNILTLGIYSAWAKVRKMRYFYDSTHLAGTSFEYHGKPKAIFKGRLIAGGMLIAYNLAPRFSMKLGYALMLIISFVMPWLIWKSLQFKLYNSSYRGIRFGFLGTCKRAYKVYLLYPILTMLSLGLLAPFTHQRIKQYQHEESRYGTSAFSFFGRVGRFYVAYLIAVLVFALGLIALFLMSGLLGASLKSGRTQQAAGMVGILIAFGFFAWGQAVYGVFMTMLQNLIWNNTRLGEHEFQSDMKIGRVLSIALTNVLFIALTLGLYTPYAKIRMMKYRVESMTLIPAGDLDGFVAANAQEVSATGEGVTDLLDFDFAL